MPLLIDKVPKPCSKIIAQKIMESDVTSLSCVSKVSEIVLALNTSHHGFPVLNLVGNATGLIPRNFLIILIKESAWYKEKIDTAALNNLR